LAGEVHYEIQMKWNSENPESCGLIIRLIILCNRYA